MNTITSFLEKVNNARQLDFGSIFSEAIELYKKTWVQGFLLQVFTIVVMLPLIIVLYIPLIGLMVAQQDSGYNDQEALNTFLGGMSLIYILFVVIGVFVLGTLSLALQASFFRIIKRMDHNEVVSTSDFFHYIKGKHLSKAFVLMLISIGIVIPSALLCYIPLIYTMVPVSYFMLIFAFNPEFSTGEIVKASFKIGTKKWGITIALFIVSYVCVMVISMITCGLGSLFLQAFLWHPIYLIYKKVVGFDETTNAIEEIGTSVE
ncbi:hypothetical protein [Algibacter sp. L4_22]|uniref:hypothetical protein n=1 Tax=Algibacter sp. L4_22 TaxID=2942477 RepID=UPI00201B72BC|nr:hypothetical protein [Algibacter sp. L4_22]MCL5129794.1 hypothetical protein [Algibacter sp. L4_22]